MRPPDGAAITLSPYRKPTLECMPVNAKAGCLYPNNARALIAERATEVTPDIDTEAADQHDPVPRDRGRVDPGRNIGLLGQ